MAGLRMASDDLLAGVRAVVDELFPEVQARLRTQRVPPKGERVQKVADEGDVTKGFPVDRILTGASYAAAVLAVGADQLDVAAAVPDIHQQAVRDLMADDDFDERFL